MISDNPIPSDQILSGNCLKLLCTIPEKSVDMIFADPPYNLQLNKKLWRPNASMVYGVEEPWDKFTNFESYDCFTREWLLACRRVLKDTGTIWVIGTYHNIFRVGRILQDLDFWILNDIVWIKNNPMPNFHGVRFTNAHETLIWAQKNKGYRYTFNYQAMKAINRDVNTNNGVQMRSDWRLPLCTGKERLKINGEKAHPTQKPEALLERVILSSTAPGDIILDPFFGSGTTGAVAKKLGRHWIGIESEPGYVSIAQQRIDSIVISEDDERLTSSSYINKEIRIPFIALLKVGLLKKGQALYFGRQGDRQAHILANGHIQYGEYTGSIHKVGRDLMNAPCNGWLAWYYIDEITGTREPIDQLRKKMRKELDLEKNTSKILGGEIK
jgi:DNA modification methylase